MDLGTLYVKLSASVAGFAKGMEAGARSVEQFAKKAKEMSEPIAGAATAVTAFGGASIALASSVDNRAARSLDGLKNSSALLAVQISDVLEPAVRSMAQGFRTAASYVAGMSDSARASVARFAIITVTVGVAAKAIGVFSGAVASVAVVVAGLTSTSVKVAGALGDVASGIASLASRVAVSVAAMGAAPLAAIAAIVAATGLLYVAWVNDWGGMRGAVDRAIERMDIVIERAKGLGPVFKGIGSDIYDALVWPFRVFVDGLVTGLGHIQAIRAAMGAGELPGVAGLKEGLEGLSKDLRTGDALKVALSSSRDAVKGIIEDTGKAVSDGIDALRKKVGGIIDGLMPKQGVVRAPSKAIEANAPEWDTEWIQSLEDSFRGVTEAVRRKPWNELIESLGSSFELAKGAWERFLGRQATFAEQSMLATSMAAGQVSKYPAEVRKAMSQDDAAKTWKQLNASQRTAGNLIKRVGASMLGNLGALGEMVNAIKDGMEAGGIWGAMIAAAMTVAKRMDGFQRMLKFFEEGLNKLAEFFGPILGWIWDFIAEQTAVGTEIIGKIIKAISPIFEAIGEVFTAVGPILGLIGVLIEMLRPALEALAKAIGAIIKALVPVIKVIFEVVKWIIVVIGGVVGAILQVVNWVMQFVGWLMEVFGGQTGKEEAAKIRGSMTNMEEYWSGVEAVTKLTWEEVDATNAATTAAWDRSIADKEAAAAAKDVAESLLNVPSGYKVAMARFNASDMNDLGWGEGSAMTKQWHDDSRDGGVPIKQPELGYDVPHRTNPTTPIVVQGDLNVSVPTGTDALGLADRTRLETAQRTGSYYSYP